MDDVLGLGPMGLRRSPRWRRERGLPWILIPRLQRLLDDAGVLDEDQRAGGSGDPDEDEALRQLASAMLDVVVMVALELRETAFA